MRRRGRTDALQTSIVKALRAVGCSVESLANCGGGIPDLLVGYHMRTCLIEVKAPRGELTPMQLEWAGRWRGEGPAIVRSVAEALTFVGATSPSPDGTRERYASRRRAKASAGGPRSRVPQS